MVASNLAGDMTESRVSVLALSSRFDGRTDSIAQAHNRHCFSTRSVESF